MPLLVFVLATCVLWGAPIIVGLFVLRRRISRPVGCALLAAAFASVTTYTLWRIEWFDVWRHGVPPLSYLLIYAVYGSVFGAIGWFLARAILPGRSVRQLKLRA
jgi:H+/Cl- antiporter ClcA